MQNGLLLSNRPLGFYLLLSSVPLSFLSPSGSSDDLGTLLGFFNTARATLPFLLLKYTEPNESDLIHF